MRIIFFCIVFLVATFAGKAQKVSDYRKSEISGCFTNYFPIHPDKKSNSFLAPGLQFTWTSYKTDSLGSQFSKVHFIAMAGINFYEYNYSFVNYTDHVLSKRFYAGYGISINKSVSKKVRVVVEICPTLQWMGDRSRDKKVPYNYSYVNTNGDTIVASSYYPRMSDDGWSLQLHNQFKLEREINRKWNFCLLFAFSPTITNLSSLGSKIKSTYNNPCFGQAYIGAGLNWKNFYRVNEYKRNGTYRDF